MIINPYVAGGTWLKGCLHAHTENSPCGHYPLEKVIGMYMSYGMKYDFLAITDHFSLTEIGETAGEGKLILFQGVEYKKAKFQMLGININKYDDDKDNSNNHQDIIDEVKRQGGFTIICHPHLNAGDYWPIEKLKGLNGYLGIEIYNNNVRLNNSGRAVATDVWDELLSSGKRVFGFANDDMHIFSRVGGAYNMVLSPEKSKESIINSIKKGSFYASSGVIFDSIAVIGDMISVRIKRIPGEIRFIGTGGKVLKSTSGMGADYVYSGSESYVRVEVRREDGAMAWTQPFYKTE